MSSERLYGWLRERARQAYALLRHRDWLAQSGERKLWVEHTNDYREKYLGYQTIAGQRICTRRIYETKNLKGPNWLVLDNSFKVTPESVYS